MNRSMWLVVSGLLWACPATPPVVEHCESSGDCADGLTCVDGSCASCRSDADCATPMVCGGETSGRCGCRDSDGDGSRCDDCDDRDPARFPGATEACDGRDNDCDGTVDEGVLTAFFFDNDGDGIGNEAFSLARCVAPVGFVTMKGDCNDADPASYPGRVESCDFRDNDCDGEIDEGVRTTYFRDGDGDGFGDPLNVVSTCQTPASGYVAVASDCDDSRADVNPQAAETCNNRDDDCDGLIDGISRSCANTCGTGQEQCSEGLWSGCTAPAILTVNATTVLTGASATFACLLVGNGGRLEVAPGMVLTTSNWLQVEATGTLELGAGASVVAQGAITFNQGILLATDATIDSRSAIEVRRDSRWYVQAPQAAPYSAGGSPSCGSTTTASGIGGAGGGARGGNGGRGGRCGSLTTVARLGAGGASAANGGDGCDCVCMNTAPGAVPSGGAGGAALAGGGGGANGGAGGEGGGGQHNTTFTDGGLGGFPEGMMGDLPLVGGGGGGSSGTMLTPAVSEACQGGGGAGAGILRVRTPVFFNEGVLSADGAPGESASGLSANHGGGGGGAGGSWVFEVDSFINIGSISAIGGRGGNGVSLGGGTAAKAGGGGGGGGGRIYVRAQDGGIVVAQSGNLFVGGGIGGTGNGTPAGAGSAGWVSY